MSHLRSVVVCHTRRGGVVGLSVAVVRFDAYAGNVRAERPQEVAYAAALAVRGGIARGRPRRRYGDVWDVTQGADLVGWVGHDHELDAAYFEFKGSTTPDTAGAIRKHWPREHTVSRLDPCEDFDEPGAFGQLVTLFDAAKDPRVQSKAITPRDGDRGSTIYWGSTQSRVMVRVYEAGKMKDRLHFNRPHWARAEAQVRPGKASEKVLAASISPLDAWGFAAWTQRAAQQLTECSVPRFAPVSTPPTFDRTTLYLARAFRRHFEQMRLDFGDWECIGRELEAVWAEDDAAKGQGLGTA